MEAFFKGQSSGVKVAKPVSSNSKGKTIPWVEKYRPRTVDDVSSQEEVVSVLKKSLQGLDFPNLLLYGPPGTGKTSTILAACRQLFGDQFKDRVLELNASDDRGINIVRTKIKKFSQLSASSFRPDGKPCPPFKVIILDEADSMTNPAQAALRRTMELEVRTTRFCIICNYVSRIIAPITSRCAKFRFKPLSRDSLISRLRHIATEEGVKIDMQSFDALREASDGDMRQAITLLQSCHSLHPHLPVTPLDVCEVAGVIPERIVDDLLEVSITSSFDKLKSTVKNLFFNGYGGSQALSQLHDAILISESFSNVQKTAVMEVLSNAEHCLQQGADEYLQLLSVCCSISEQVMKG